MLPKTFEKYVEEERKMEFKRQQDKLRMMAPSVERRAVSTDAMIDSLLQKSDTFKKVNNELPAWLQVGSPQCCPFYEKVWDMVKLTDKIVDTPRISGLLLTSGLYPDALAFIWSLANKTTPGHLTKQELFMVLALVGLAQSGYTFNNLSVLNIVPSAPIPILDVSFPTAYNPGHTKPNSAATPGTSSKQIASFPYSMSAAYPANAYSSHITANNLAGIDSTAIADDDFQDFQFATIEPISSSKTVPLPTLMFPDDLETSSSIFHVPTPSAEVMAIPKATFLEPFEASNISSLFTQSTPTHVAVPPSSISIINTDAYDSVSSSGGDEFTDFQSADAFDTSIVQPTKISLTKLSSFIKVSPESERKLRHIAQPESLSALPESKISSRNKVSSMPSIPVLASSRSVGNRLANHSLGTKQEKNKNCHQMKVKPIFAGGTTVVPSEELFARCLTKPSTFLLKETKIPSTELDSSAELSEDRELTRRIEIPIVGTFKETTLPVDMKPNLEKSPGCLLPVVNQNDTLLSLEEDKYGALRELELQEPNNSAKTCEDFGEFLSADLPSEKAVEAWTAWNSSVNVPEFDVAFDDELKTNDSFDVALANMPMPSKLSLHESTTAVAATAEPGFMHGGLDLMNDSFDLTLSNLSMSAPVDNLSLGEYQNSEILPDLEKNSSEHNRVVISNKMFVNEDFNDFGDFVTPTIDQSSSDAVVPKLSLGPREDSTSMYSSTPSFDLSLPRHDSWSSLELSRDKDVSGKHSRKNSVPSLDLQIDVEPHTVSSRCLECCHSLLKEAMQIFNGVSDQSILKEVFDTQQAKNYIKYLKIVYYIARRITLNGGDSNAVYDDINYLWRQIEELALCFSVPLEDTEPEVVSGVQPCAVCKGITTDTDIEQNGSRFHASCANLWINCIEKSLPCF